MLQAHLREAPARHLPRSSIPLHRNWLPRRLRLSQQIRDQQLLLASQLDRPRGYGTVWNSGRQNYYIIQIP